MSRIARLLVAVISVAVLLVSIVRAGGDSPIAKAVKSGDIAALRKLIASKADVNEAAADGTTPLLWAAYNNDADMAKALIAAGAKLETANNYGVTPLLQASRTGDAAVMDVLLKAGADPKRAHPEGETPLMAAARSGHADAVKLLLAKNVDINAVDSFENQSALMRAAAEGHTEVVNVLLAAGANPNLKARVNSLTDRKNADHPTGGFTALMWAARNGFEDTVRALVKGGADMKLTNGDGATATMIAIFNDRFDMAKTLVELGADANDGSLYAAVEMRDSTTDQFAFDGSRLRIDHPNKLTALDLVGYLIDKGADAHKTFTGQMHSYSMPNSDRYDNSPLFRAAVAGDVECLKTMIAHGVDVNKPMAGTPPAAAAVAAPPADDAAVVTPPAGGRGARGNPNAGRVVAMVAMTGGRGPSMTGGPGYIRSGPVPYREPGDRDATKAFVALIKGGANPNVKGPDGSPLLHQVVQANNLDMLHALADAKVDFNAKNNAGLTALEAIESRANAAPAAGGRGARGAAPPAGGARGGAGARGGTTPQQMAAELRKLMGLPPAPPQPAAANTAVPPVPGAPAAGDTQQ